MKPEEIIKGCHEGDRVAQSALYNLYSKKMYGVCLAYAKDREAAQDILHDGFMKVFTKFHQYKDDGSIEGWVRRIMVNTALDHVRRTTKFRNVELEEKHEPSLAANNTRDRMHANDLMSLVDKLPLGARTVFNLYTLEGYNHKEIAKMLDINEGTSKSQYFRAKKILRGLVTQHYS